MKIRSHLKYSTLCIAMFVLPLTGWAQGGVTAGKDKAAAAKTASPAAAKKTAKNKKATKKKKKSTAIVQREVTLGVYALNDPSYRYGKYSGLTDNGAFGLFDFKLDRRPDPSSDDTTRWRIEGKRLGLDSRRFEFDYWQQGKQRFRFDFREIPNKRFDDGQTPYRWQSDGSLALPWDWSVNPYNATTKGFLNLQSSMRTMKIDTLRRRFDAVYGLKLGGGWRIDVDYKHETKNGYRTLGGIFGYTFYNARSVILPAPVDYKTDNVEATLGFAGPRMQVNLSVFASFFRNEDNTLVFQNAYAHEHDWNPAVSYPDSMGRIALEPDNRYYQFRANVGFNLAPGTRLTSDASVGTMKQTDNLLPYTINPDLNVQTPVPLNKLDGKVDTSMLNLRLTSRLARRLGLAVNYHYDKRDNKTPQALYAYIGADSQDQRSADLGRINLPYSYTRKKSDALVTYRFSKVGRLRAGVEYLDYKRDYQEVRNSDEFIWRAGVTLRGWSMASVNFDYRNSSRDVSNYVANAPLLASYPSGTYGADDFQNHPLLRKYFLTDRDRDEYRLRADFFPDPRVNLGVSASYDKDDYGKGYFGLNSAKVRNWTIDAGYYPKDNVTLTAFYTWEKYNADQSSRYITSADSVADPANDWFASSEDRVDTWNITLTFKDIGKDKGWKGVEAGMDYTYSKTDSAIDVTSVSVVTAPLPDLLSKQQMFSIWSRFTLGKRSSIRLSAQSAKLTSKDWALDGVEPDTVSRVLLPGQAAANYDLWLVSVAWSYRF